jgi:DNA-binding beta-propeller fold protein YncE
MGVALAGCFSDVTNNPVPGETPPDAGVDATPIPAPPFTAGASTLAGAAEAGMVDGDRDNARFDDPVTANIGSNGVLYVADFNNARVRAVTADGEVTTAVQAPGFERPFGVAIASPNVLYVQTDDNDLGLHSLDSGTIWRADIAAKTATVVVRNIGRPRGIALLPDGRLVLSDNEHHVIRVLEPGTGTVTILAGRLDTPGHDDASGMGARFNKPYGIAVRPDGKIVVADYGNNVIRLLEMSGSMHTLTGNLQPGHVDGPVETARFAAPQDVAVTADGTIFVADSDNHVIRRIGTDGMVTTVAGNGNKGYVDHDDPMQAEFYGLEGIDVSPDGRRLYVADGDRGEGTPFHRIRVINLAP